MNQGKLTKRIEQAEERAVCEVAKAEPGLFKLRCNQSVRGDQPPGCTSRHL